MHAIHLQIVEFALQGFHFLFDYGRKLLLEQAAQFADFGVVEKAAAQANYHAAIHRVGDDGVTGYYLCGLCCYIKGRADSNNVALADGNNIALADGFE